MEELLEEDQEEEEEEEADQEEEEDQVDDEDGVLHADVDVDVLEVHGDGSTHTEELVGGGGDHVDVGLGAGAEEGAGELPPSLYHQFTESTPTLSGAKYVKRPTLMSRPSQGQPGHWR